MSFSLEFANGSVSEVQFIGCHKYALEDRKIMNKLINLASNQRVQEAALHSRRALHAFASPLF